MFKTAYEAALEGLGHLLRQGEARETIRGNAARVIARTADDFAIGSHGSGRPQLGPLLFEGAREHLLPRHRALRVQFNGHGQLGRWQLVAIGHVAHVPGGSAALGSEGLTVLVTEIEEVGSEVHNTRLHHLVLRASTPFGVAWLLYSFDE